ncbi:hypothetical protein SDC9_186344 [bioreactor metagenome]|uniref:Uncharacterized protein n=1 Tax=bioreactor metagenome TaxID=1076179 RepID=A0A645HKR9_9ZZZZ
MFDLNLTIVVVVAARNELVVELMQISLVKFPYLHIERLKVLYSLPDQKLSYYQLTVTLAFPLISL